MSKKITYNSINYKQTMDCFYYFLQFLLPTTFSLIFFFILTSCSSIKTELDNNQNTKPTADQLNNAANTNIELGLYYLEQKNIPQAQEKLLLALQQSPQNFIAYDAMGYFLETIQEISTAEKYYQQAIKITPNNGAAHNNYGAFLYRQHRCQEALTQFLIVVQDINYLNLAAVYENAGLTAMCLNEKTQAKKYFAKALLIEPQRRKNKKIYNSY